jgi:hypothetical protein
MNNKKTVFAFLVCTVLCAAVFAQNEGDFKTDGNGTITKYEGWDTRIVIPAQIGGMPITGIDDGAFKNMGITSVTLPASIKYIRKGAFADNKITTLTIPDNVLIEYAAFSDNQLTSLTIGNGCIIVDNSFSRNRLTSLTVGNDCSISSITFNTDTNNLKNIVLGANNNFNKRSFGDFLFFDYIFNGKKAGTYDASVRYTKKKEGDYEFYETKYGAVIVKYTGNEGARLIIPGKLGNSVVKGIDGENNIYGTSFVGAFANKNISRMQLPESLIYIGDFAFYDNKLTSITIPTNVTFIGMNAFERNQLPSITIPASVTFIDVSAFANNQLTSVTIPASVTFIGVFAFDRNQLTSVTFEKSWVTLNGLALNDLDSRYAAFDGNLSTVYTSSGAGTYTRESARSSTWTKQ